MNVFGDVFQDSGGTDVFGDVFEYDVVVIGDTAFLGLRRTDGSAIYLIQYAT